MKNKPAHNNFRHLKNYKIQIQMKKCSHGLLSANKIQKNQVKKNSNKKVKISNTKFLWFFKIKNLV